jgi:hypothetical protein
MRATRGIRLATMALATTQIYAACYYSPPPMLSQAQAADTLGSGTVAATGELGYATAGSWWNSSNLSDVDVTDGVVGAGRLRLGLSDDVDVGVVNGYGPHRGFVVAPELKWRFLHLTPDGVEDPPAFHGAWISGFGIGAADFSLDEAERGPRHAFIAPYTGLLASGGVRAVQMYTGFRFAASETLGDGHQDLTLYPTLAFGVEARPSAATALFAEGIMAGALTTTDFGDSAILVYPSAGVTVRFE